MLHDNDNMKPIYVQIAEWLEWEILKENIGSHEKIYSQYQLADMFNINPATAAKGITLLLEQNLLYQRRGLGTFVSSDAKEQIRQKRIEHNLKYLARELVAEANRLEISEDQLIDIISSIKEQTGEGENG